MRYLSIRSRLAFVVLASLAGVGCGAVDEPPNVLGSGGEVASSATSTVTDVEGNQDPGACLEYPAGVHVDHPSIFGLLAEDGWIRTAEPIGAVLGKMDTPSGLRGEGAKRQVGRLRPSQVDSTTYGGAIPEATPVHQFVVQRLQRHGNGYESVFLNFAGPGPGSSIVAIGENADGSLDFVMDCGGQYESAIKNIVRELGDSLTGVEVVESLIESPNGDVAQAAQAEAASPPSKSERWAATPNDRRQVDPETAPDAVLESLHQVRLWFDVPQEWGKIDGTLCPRIPVGWSTCIEFPAMAHGALPLYVEPGGSVNWMTLDRSANLLQPIGPIGSDGADQFLGNGRAPDMQPVLRSSVEASSMEELMQAADEASARGEDVVSVEWVSLSEIEARLPASRATPVEGSESQSVGP